MSDSSRPHGLQPTRLLRPWDFPGKSTRVGCHCLLLLCIKSCWQLISLGCGSRPVFPYLCIFERSCSFFALFVHSVDEGAEVVGGRPISEGPSRLPNPTILSLKHHAQPSFHPDTVPHQQFVDDNNYPITP